MVEGVLKVPQRCAVRDCSRTVRNGAQSSHHAQRSAYATWRRCGCSGRGSYELSSGWRRVKFTDRHTAVDYAHVLKDLADIHFPRARTIVLAQDNLNIHSKASLYEAFPAAEARRLVERFEWHYTPKHGSWLDLAEVRTRRPILSVPRSPHPRQAKSSPREVAAWQDHRNKRHAKADWQFTTANAASKLKGLYPQFE